MPKLILTPNKSLNKAHKRQKITRNSINTFKSNLGSLLQNLNEQESEEHLKNNIKKIRNEKRLTQDALARKADLPYTTLTKLESGVITKPTIQTVVKIAKGLEISIDELIK